MPAEPLILHLETATNVCSVALSEGEKILATRESSEDRSHGTLLTVFVEEVLKEAGKNAEQLDAVAVSKGPGSYTGLRIGVSATKGIAYARNIPVIGIGTLQSMTLTAMENKVVQQLLKDHPDLLFCPMIDARRMEVFSAIYDASLKETAPVSAIIVEENSFKNILDKQPVVFFGNGADKVRDTIRHEKAHFITGLEPSSKQMIPLASEAFRKKQFEDTAYFEPFYLKDFIATIPKKKVL
jgi:tRNA threonylcarbamoyladenosine biosynthesis protein TsaB